MSMLKCFKGHVCSLSLVIICSWNQVNKDAFIWLVMYLHLNVSKRKIEKDVRAFLIACWGVLSVCIII